MAEDLVLLMECSNGLEVASVKSLLEGEGIAHVVQGEFHASLLGGTTMTTAITPRVLVHGVDLERAMALLEAPVGRGGPTGEVLQDCVCPVHEQPARATCDRCGTFLCAACGTLGNPPLCEACVEVESKGVAPGSAGQRRWRSVFGLAIPVGILVLVALLMHFFGVVRD